MFALSPYTTVSLFGSRRRLSAPNKEQEVEDEAETTADARASRFSKARTTILTEQKRQREKERELGVIGNAMNQPGGNSARITRRDVGADLRASTTVYLPSRSQGAGLRHKQPPPPLERRGEKLGGCGRGERMLANCRPSRAAPTKSRSVFVVRTFRHDRCRVSSLSPRVKAATTMARRVERIGNRERKSKNEDRKEVRKGRGQITQRDQMRKEEERTSLSLSRCLPEERAKSLRGN